jgi:hypothetical protein
MKKLMSLEEAKKILAPHLAAVNQIYRDAYEDLNRASAAARTEMDKASRSKLLHNFAVNRAKQHFGDVPDVLKIVKYLSIQLVFNNAKENLLVGRFKKIDRKTRLSAFNPKSNRSCGIAHQQYTLFDNFAITHVDFGYCTNYTNSGIEFISVVCRLGKEVLWSFDLSEDELKNENPITTSPTSPSTILVKLKKAD